MCVVQVARAYKTLTDPAAKENFEKYGNPDGKQSLAVSASVCTWLHVLDEYFEVVSPLFPIFLGLIS